MKLEEADGAFSWFKLKRMLGGAFRPAHSKAFRFLVLKESLRGAKYDYESQILYDECNMISPLDTFHSGSSWR